MNRLRPRKKSFGSASREGSRQASRRPSMDEDVPAVPSFASKFMRKKVAPPAEPKSRVDLAVALPPSDDFRTSLLMPNLSARFSLLKEQDDPTSLLGKANDDSVLFPKRASRLDLFNTRPGLSDIAEVESRRGSGRPPFAVMRTDSCTSEGYATDDGSIMSRAKPGEGNTMFGGRQKIYKIPVGGAGSVKNFGGLDEHESTTGGAMSGKPVYESDTNLSTFQRLRQAEREDRERRSQDESTARPSREQDRSGSPPYNRYNRNRETSSSTTSAPSQSRASTAATSIASQKSVYAAQDNINGLPASLTQAPPGHSERAFIKTRRLYGQAVDRDPGNHQQPLQRVGSFNRFRGPTSGLASNPLRQSRSASNLGGRFQGDVAIQHINNQRAASPALSTTPPKMSEFDLGLHSDSSLKDVTDSGSGRSPPLSPPKSPDLISHNPDPTLVASLEPNDVGKATASGAFNKPKKQYDEHQYLQRQLQMQSDRDTPSPQFSRPFSPALSILNDQASAGRSRNNSQGSGVSRNNSVRRQWLEDRVPRPVPDPARHPAYRTTPENPVRPSLERSFFTSNSASSPDQSPRFFGDFESPNPDVEAHNPDPLSGEDGSNLHGLDFGLSRQNSATTSESPDDTPSESRSYHSGTTITQLRNLPLDDERASSAINADSPTLGPVHQTDGLSGLVRAHLRSDSGQSSIYPEDLQRRSRRFEGRESILGHSSALNDQMLHDPMPVNYHQEVESRQNLSFAAHNMLEQARSLKAAESDKAKGTLGGDKAQRILGREAPRSHTDGNFANLEQTRSYHNRGVSTETQQERQDLAQELADRRKIVQDRLQSFVEAESRSQSPAPSSRSRSGSAARAMNPMSLLKKPSQSSLGGKEKNSKALKMLGIESDNGENPMPDNSVMRDQLSNRTLQPSSNNTSSINIHARETPLEMSEALGLDQPRNRTHGSQERHTKQRSPQSSKSDSAYSRTSEMTALNHTSRSANGSFASQYEQSTNGNMNAARTQGSDAAAPFMQQSTQPAWSNMGPDRTGQGVPARIYSDNHSSSIEHSNSGRRAAPAGTPYMINPANRTKAPNFSKSVSVPRDHPPLHSVNQHSARNSPTKPMFRSGQHRKQSINKQDISEPTFISSTSSVDTIDLPLGASLKNGMESPSSPTSPPPIPDRDSRRKRTATFRQAFGRSDKGADNIRAAIVEERSTFSDDEPTQKPKQRLRKVSRDDAISMIKKRPIDAGASNPTSPMEDRFVRHAPKNAIMF